MEEDEGSCWGEIRLYNSVVDNRQTDVKNGSLLHVIAGNISSVEKVSLLGTFP